MQYQPKVLGSVLVDIARFGGINQAKAYQKLPMPAEPSLVRSGCWLIAPEIASKRLGHAKYLFDADTCY